MKKVYLYAGIYEGKGAGHIVRTASLVMHLKETTELEIEFCSNDNTWANSVLERMEINISAAEFSTNNCDVLLIDSPEEEGSLNIGHKHNIRLDYFNYENNKVNTIINLLNQDKGYNPTSFKGDLHSGLDFLILRKDLRQSKQVQDVVSGSKQTKVLITIGGEDTNNIALDVIELLQPKNMEVTWIKPAMKNSKGKELQLQNVNIVNPTNRMADLYITNDVIICGGGTTLLEALFFNKTVIAMAQNNLEESFIKYVSSQTRVFGLNELQLALSTRGNENSIVDGLGIERIAELITLKV